MSSFPSAILSDILEALQSLDIFASVSLGSAGGQSEVPRAELHLSSEQIVSADDTDAARWHRLECVLELHTRAGRPAEGLARLAELTDQAVNAVLTDPYRGGQCVDLPTGRATELISVHPNPSVPPPKYAAKLTFRCHHEEDPT